MSKKNYAVTIAGGGSTFTPGIALMLLEERDRFPVNKVTFYDNNAERQETVAKACEIYFHENAPEVEFSYTTDPETAFTGTDFVLAHIRVGLYAMRELDEKIPLKYGCVGQETCGAGGIAYGMRSIGGVIEILDYMEKYSPNAWMLNYSNPASIVAEACRVLRPNSKIINICDMPVGTLRRMSYIVGKTPKDLDVKYYGLNHFGWWTHLYDKSGVDRMPELKEKIMKFGLAASHDKHHSDPSWRHTWENFKEILTDFPEYLPNTYLQYYLYAKESAEDMDPNYTRANMVMDGREKDMIEQAKLIRESGGKKEANLNLFNAFGDFIVDVACSIAYNNADRYLVIVENLSLIHI